MGGACNAHGYNEKVMQAENVKGRDQSEAQGVDGKILLGWILGKLGGKLWTGCI
jgi:hypothetical protein